MQVTDKYTPIQLLNMVKSPYPSKTKVQIDFKVNRQLYADIVNFQKTQLLLEGDPQIGTILSFMLKYAYEDMKIKGLIT